MGERNHTDCVQRISFQAHVSDSCRFGGYLFSLKCTLCVHIDIRILSIEFQLWTRCVLYDVDDETSDYRVNINIYNKLLYTYT